MRLRVDRLASRRAECAQLGEVALGLLGTAAVEDGDRGGRAAVHRAPEREARPQLVGPGRDELSEAGGELAGPLDRVGERPVRDRPGERVQTEAESCRDPEVGAGPAEPPEEVLVLLVARPDLAAVGRDELDPEQVVDRVTVLALEPTHAPSERQTGDPGVGHDADRADEPDRLGLPVELAEERATVHPGRALGGVDPHAVHPRQVDDDPVVAGREAGDAVAAAADGDRELLLTPEADGGDHVVGIRGPGDQLRVAIDHPVPDDAGVVVPRIVAADDLPGEPIGEAADRSCGRRHTGFNPRKCPWYPVASCPLSSVGRAPPW